MKIFGWKTKEKQQQEKKRQAVCFKLMEPPRELVLERLSIKAAAGMGRISVHLPIFQLGLHDRWFDDKLKKAAFDQLCGINFTYDHKDLDLFQRKWQSAEYFFSKFRVDTILPLIHVQ